MAKDVSPAELESVLREMRNKSPQSVSVSELVRRKHEFIHRLVDVTGILNSYEMGPGIFTWPVILVLEDAQYRIPVNFEISRFNGEHHQLKPYVENYLGRAIQAKVFMPNYTAKSISFGDVTFNLRS